MNARRAIFVGMAGVMALIAPVLHAQPLTRAAAATLALPVEPPSFGYVTEVALNGMSFNQPLAVVSAPGESDRLFVVEKPGRIILVRDPGSAAPSSSVFLDISDVVTDSGEQGLLALAFHPDFATNGHLYVWYTLSTTTGAGSGRHDRLSRFTVSPADPDVAAVDSEVPLISQFDQAANHNGGELKFGPDGYLYLSTGDEGGSGDSYDNGQRIDRDFFSAMLRIDVDQKPGSLPPNPHPAVHAGTYQVPADNPYVGATSFNGLAVDAASVRTEFWAVGLRNPFRFSIDPSTGQLWLGDVGQGAREEVDIITRGGNYGWPYREGLIAYRSDPPAGAVFVDPVHDYPRSAGSTITGGVVYRGTQLSQIYGAYLFADYGSGRIWSLRTAINGPAEVDLLATNPGIVGFGVNPANGDILLANINEGRIRRLVYSTQTGAPFPEHLSETGAFSSVATLAPAPGVVAYEPNVSFWSDHARKSRWFALPDASTRFGYHPTANWTLPAGAVWVKHFDLELTRGDPSTARRIETRFLVKTSDGVYGLSYRWNEEQTDAALVPESGVDEDFVVSEDGVLRSQTWRYPSRSECLACHTPQGGYALSFNTRQLNRVHAFPGGAANQVSALAQAGYLDGVPAEPETLPALVPGSDTTQSIESRVKSYLDANCAQCHRPGGTALGTWDARFETPLASAGIIDGALVDNDGDAENRVIAPGDVTHSRLYHRMSATSGATRMPPIGSNERDLASEQLVVAWIESLAAPKEPATITLSNLAGTYNGASWSVGVSTVPSGLAVVITVDGASSAPSNAGTYTVNATIDDPTFGGTTTGSLVIEKAPLTARAADAARLQGAPNPPLTIHYTGFVAGDTAADLDTPPTASTTALTASPSGSYPITLSGGADDNYTLTLVDGTLTVSTAPQTISFTAPVDRVYGDGPFTLAATATSGLPVGFIVVSGPATISGSTVTISGAGTVTVRATQAGNVTFAPAPAVERSFSIAKAPLTARADDQGKLQGAPNPPLTIHYTGFVAGDSAVDLDTPPTASTTALTASPSGSYPITLSGGADDNYTLTLVDGTLTVSTAPQTISFTALADRVYGDGPFTLAATATSGLPVGFIVVSGPATISGSTVTISGAGTVTVRATQAGNVTFAPAPAVERSFSIAKAPLTARAVDQGKLQGTANPPLTINYTGFVAGDTAADLDTPPTASTTALTASPSGSYPITLSGGADDNYTLTLVDGVLTVSTANESPTISSQPVSLTLQAMQSASFTVVASGVPSPTYQWQRRSSSGSTWVDLADGDGFSGSSSATLVHAGVLTSMSGDMFRCVVTNGVDPSATSDAASLSVAKASASIILGELTRVYDGEARGVVVETTPENLPVAITYDGSAGVPSDAGSYLVEAVVDHPEYAGTAVGTLTVGKAVLVVRADDKSRAFGESNPVLTASYTGFVGNDTPGVLASPAVATTDATELSPVGTYTILVTGGDAANYALDHVSGALTVTKATASVSIADTHWIYDGQPKAVTIATTPAGLGVEITYDGDVAAPTQAGSYEVVAVIRDSNYAGSATATLFVEVENHAGSYFGTLSHGGFWAMHIAADRTGTFVAYAPVEAGAIVNQVFVQMDGSFSSVGTASLDARHRSLGAISQSMTLTGRIATGVVTGQIPELGASMAGSLDSPGGPTSAHAGFFVGTGLDASVGVTYAVVGSNGTALVVVATETFADGGMMSVGTDGKIVGVLAGSTVMDMSIDAGSGQFAGLFVPGGTGAAIEIRGLSSEISPVNHIVNLSARGQVRTNDDVMIVGFVISGSGQKSVLLRGIGPTLGDSPFNVSDTLADPEIVLRRQSDGSLIASNDNWGSSPDVALLNDAFALTGAFQIPSQSRDAALIATLPAGHYTAVVSGRDESPGNAMAEVYSIEESNSTTRLVNVSARAFVGTGDSILIPGVTTIGNAPRRLLVRGIGPSLALEPFRVTGVLEDPVLHVHVWDKSDPVASNDNWDANESGDEIATISVEVGAFPLARGSRDAALLFTIPPNTGYTILVSGRNGGTGVVLAEVYELP